MSVANICAVNFVAFTNVVARLLPSNLTTEPLTKLLPLTVRVKAAPPIAALVGETLLTAGRGLLTVIFTGLEVPPPGEGLLTVIGYVPAA